MLTINEIYLHYSEKKFVKLLKSLTSQFDPTLIPAAVAAFDPTAPAVTDEQKVLTRLNHMIEDAYAMMDSYAPNTMTRPIDHSCYTNASHCIILAILNYKLGSCAGLTTNHIQDEYDGAIRMLRDFGRGLLTLCTSGTVDKPVAGFCYESGKRDVCKYKLECDPCKPEMPYGLTKMHDNCSSCAKPAVPESTISYVAGEDILPFKPVSLVGGLLYTMTVANAASLVGVSQNGGVTGSLINVI